MIQQWKWRLSLVIRYTTHTWQRTEHQNLVWWYLPSGDLCDITSTQDRVHPSISQPGLAALLLRVNDVSSPCHFLCVCGMEWFFTRSDEGIKGVSTSSNRCSVLMGCHQHVNSSPNPHLQHIQSLVIYDTDAVLIEWGPCIDSLRHAHESLPQNGWICSSLLANNAGYQRLKRGGGGVGVGGGWTRQTISSTDSQGKHCSRLLRSNPRLQTLMPWH